MAERLQGRIKQEYKRNSMILLGGVEFRKDDWVLVPKGKEKLAKETLGDLLDFQGVSEASSQEEDLDLHPVPEKEATPLSSLEEEPEVSPEPEPDTPSEETGTRSYRRKRKKAESE
jgi:hypothetical protein